MDARLREGVRLFNEQRYFESHEIWEELYRETEERHKPFLEALVQLAAALRLFVDFGEVPGTVRMIRQALIRLENYQPSYLAIKVKDLSVSLERWAHDVESAGSGGAGPIPRIKLRRFPPFR
ncbi:MAG TPA: DUF309 domain-containing protein [candidate division Zixibacteria bacterium]|nr:DUF309 domain-containing protein [candidate division Zixibacteria bacterium]